MIAHVQGGKKFHKPNFLWVRTITCRCVTSIFAGDTQLVTLKCFRSCTPLWNVAKELLAVNNNTAELKEGRHLACEGQYQWRPICRELDSGPFSSIQPTQPTEAWTQPMVWLVWTRSNPTITVDQTFSSEILKTKYTGINIDRA